MQDRLAASRVAHGAQIQTDPAVEALVREIIGRVADKWTMLVIDAMEEHGVVRFTQLGDLVGGISQKMLTKTLRQMERDGLVTRKVYPVIPPHVEYALTDLGHSLGAAFCGVWMWAEENGKAIAEARRAFDGQAEAEHLPAAFAPLDPV
jgi:DNA-binding HxlR family transcriptional regulator